MAVSEDKLAAYICPKDQVPEEISLDDIKELLVRNGIKYGIVDDTGITEYLKNRPIRKKPWKIAQGKATEPAQHAKVSYHFDTDPSKIGKLKQGSAIDFKDRGEIPQVKKGDLIAEKIPGMDGTPGTDVFGNSIPSPKSKDVCLKCGRGAEESEDGLQVFARLDGQPEISAHGKVFVLSELKISGDVGLETGHIDFAGNIDVSGSVQDGFRVRGGRLSAKEIGKAEIDIAGDVVVLGGIIGARIKAGANVRATHIRGSNIKALGDVVVDNELLNSRIESSGACLVKRGKILSSQISAKKGIEAKDIGSDASRPCNLVVGLDERASRQIDELKEQIMLKKEEYEKHETLVDELQEESKKLDKEIGELAQVQDRAMVEQRTLSQNMEELEKTNNTEKLAQTEMLLKDLGSKISQAEKKLEPLLDRQDQVTKEVASIQNKIRNCEQEIKEFQDEIEALSEWLQKEKPVPIVKVYGTIFSQSTIRGVHSAATIGKTMHNVRIRETKTFDSDSGIQWKISVSQLN